MKNKKGILLLFVLIFLQFVIFPSVQSQTTKVGGVSIDLGDVPKGGNGISNLFSSLGNPSEIDAFLETLENLGRVAELGAEQIAPYIFELSDKGLSQLSAEQLEYEDSSGIRTINKIDDWNKLSRNARDEALSEITGREISTDNEYT